VPVGEKIVPFGLISASDIRILLTASLLIFASVIGIHNLGSA